VVEGLLSLCFAEEEIRFRQFGNFLNIWQSWCSKSGMSDFESCVFLTCEKIRS
jgi:hypothetical protein